VDRVPPGRNGRESGERCRSSISRDVATGFNRFRARWRRRGAPPAPAVDSLFAETLGEFRAPRASPMASRLDGELLHSGAAAVVRSLESGASTGRRHRLPAICSMTKSFMAMVVLSLRDEGRLDIDAPLGELAADLAVLAEAGPDAPPVTVRQLLTMGTAGLPQDDPLGGSPEWADDNAWVSDEVFARGSDALARAPRHGLRVLQLRPGPRLGRVVEAVQPGQASSGRRARGARARPARPEQHGLERRRPAARARWRAATGRRATASRRRCRSPTAATSPGARRPLQQACATIARLERPSSSTRSPRATRPERAPVSRATLARDVGRAA